MNRREILQLGAFGLLAAAVPVSAANAALVFKPLTHYWFKTRLWLREHCEWHSEPVMRIVAPDGSEVWSWRFYRYDDEDERRRHDFRWHLHFSDNADGMIEGWIDGKSVIAVGGPNLDPEFQELYYERPNRCIRLGRMQWL
jgi:hypothetical protein